MMSTSVVSLVRLLLSTRGSDDYFQIHQASVHVESSCNLLLFSLHRHENIRMLGDKLSVSFGFDTYTVKLGRIQVLTESLPSTYDSTNDLDSKPSRFFLDASRQYHDSLCFRDANRTLKPSSWR
jgi:hypothetical protein